MTFQHEGISVEWCNWNPKNLPLRKTGKCENSEHDEWIDDIHTDEELHLVMLWSDFYNSMIESDKKNMSEEEKDVLWDEAETKKWKPNSESYWCKDCLEILQDAC